MLFIRPLLFLLLLCLLCISRKKKGKKPNRGRFVSRTRRRKLLHEAIAGRRICLALSICMQSEAVFRGCSPFFSCVGAVWFVRSFVCVLWLVCACRVEKVRPDQRKRRLSKSHRSREEIVGRTASHTAASNGTDRPLSLSLAHSASYTKRLHGAHSEAPKERRKTQQSDGEKHALFIRAFYD